MNYAHSHEVAASLWASQHVLPRILDLIRTAVSPHQAIASAVDFGGGTGAWMSTLFHLGVTRGKVIDSPVSESELLVPKEDFVPANLAQEIPHLGRFDLAMCLEVAEHVPCDKSVPLVKALVASAPIVFFSAAIPGQPGLGHINCQDHEYWHALFEAEGYKTYDVIRPLFLYDQSIPSWYRQNCFLYIDSSRTVSNQVATFPSDMELIAKSNFQQYTHPSLKTITKRFLPALVTSLRYHLRRRQNG